MKSNERGFTLVELLAAITLAALVIILLGSVHLFAQKQYQTQTESVNHQKEVRLAMTSITQQLRTVANYKDEEAYEDSVDFHDNTLSIGEKIYYWDETNHTITLNGTLIASEIASLDVQLDRNETTGEIYKVNLTIQSLENKQGKIAELTSTIYIRE